MTASFSHSLPADRTYRVDQALIDHYAAVSGDHNPLHTDPAFAATTAYGRTIAHGMMTLAFVSDAMAAWLGERWGAASVIDVTFLAPVFPGDDIVVAGTMSGGGEPSCRFECRVDRGPIAVGEARIVEVEDARGG